MPIYEYECSNRHRFERRQGFHDETVALCPQCEARAQRVLHAVPVIFKGSGFYVTDYGKNNAALGSGNGSKGEAPSEGKPAQASPKENKPKVAEAGK